MNVLVALLAVGASARLTRLISIDIWPPVQRFREWTVHRFGEDHWIPEMVFCPWCIGMWVSVLVGASAYLVGGSLFWQVPAAVLSLAFVSSALVVHTDT